MSFPIENREILAALRWQAWERAKGELRAALATHIDEREKHEHLSKLVEDFITAVEDTGAQE